MMTPAVVHRRGANKKLARRSDDKSYECALRWAEEVLRENCGLPALPLKLR